MKDGAAWQFQVSSLDSRAAYAFPSSSLAQHPWRGKPTEEVGPPSANTDAATSADNRFCNADAATSADNRFCNSVAASSAPNETQPRTEKLATVHLRCLLVAGTDGPGIIGVAVYAAAEHALASGGVAGVATAGATAGMPPRPDDDDDAVSAAAAAAALTAAASTSSFQATQ